MGMRYLSRPRCGSMGVRAGASAGTGLDADAGAGGAGAASTAIGLAGTHP